VAERHAGVEGSKEKTFHAGLFQGGGAAMFSQLVKAALDKEIAGQRRAVNSVVRGVTRAVSGLAQDDTPLCSYLLMGPTGTGKTHLVRTLAKVLHGQGARPVVADCTHTAQGDPWSGLVSQIAPLFLIPHAEHKWTILDTPHLSVILIDYLERGRPEVSRALAAALETGHITLPEGRHGSLRNALVFITSSLCSREIFAEGSGIGFAGGVDEKESEDEEKLFWTCHNEAEQQFGSDLMARLDGLLIFHPLQDQQLEEILERKSRSLNERLARYGFQCRLQRDAREFLLEMGRHNLKFGARNLVRAHRRYVEFPVSDLMISGRIPRGGLLVADRGRDDSLHFTIRRSGCSHLLSPPETLPQAVQVHWEEDPPGQVH
jgi:ATP-dependent Clp protease ATP-binding subunit ClpC